MLLFLLACPQASDEETPVPTYLDRAIVDEVSMTNVKAHVDFLADDGLAGRIPGSPGHAIAVDYLLGELEAIDGLEPLGPDGFRHEYVSEAVDGRYQLLEDGTVAEAQDDHGTNLVALLPGTDPTLSSQYVVVMAHYDHLGVTEEGEVFNGAFDDATAVGVLLELARVLTEEEVELERSIVFLFTDDEESGLEGAEWFLEDELVPHSEIVLAISVDPMGRGVLPDYYPLALMGLERSPDLQARFKDLTQYSETAVGFIKRDVIPLFASDQDEFYRVDEPICAVWFTSPGMTFYHTVEDTPETIDYRSVRPQARWLLQVLAWFGQHDEVYEYVGEPELAPVHAADARDLVVGYLGSEYLGKSDRSEVETLLADLDAIVAADSLDVVDNPDALFVYAVYFLVFELPSEYPGEVPPPFPEE